MKTKITTDWHIAVRRMAGTTPATQQALRDDLRAALESNLDDTDHLIMGDVFNDFTVEASELIATYTIFSEWLDKYGRKLALLRGNHDHSMRGTQASSFDLLGHILKRHFPDQVTVADEVMEWKQFVLIPHLPNNDILNVEVAKLGDVRDKVVVFHANVDNFFASDSQHSLNLSMEQVEDLVGRGNLVLVGHEHQHRQLVDGRCVVLGNTAPSSVADCIGNDAKFCAYVSGTECELVETWKADGNFAELDWRDLSDGGHKFIRVVGDAAAEQAADVVNAIAKFRQASSAYVISNSVKIEGQELLAEMGVDSVEAIKKFDVTGAIFSRLTEREIEVVKELLNA